MIFETQGYAMYKGWAFASLPLLIYIVLMAVLIYVNTLVLIPLLLNKKKTALYVTGVVFLMIFYTYLRSLNQQYWDAIVWPKDIMTVQSYYQHNLFYAIWFSIISSMLFFTQTWYDQRQQVKNIQINQLRTELKYLRLQVNPHFLFNGLNTIYGNIDPQNKEARDILVQFSDLLRYNLYDADTDLVDLGKEKDYLENYVALQRARTEKTLFVDLKIDIENPSVKIAPLLFIPFVENAFKFVSRKDNSENKIKIHLQQKGKQIIFECENSYELPEENKGGIGLNNVKRRLELLYKDHHKLNITKDDSLFTVQLTVDV
jgi:LytS/YehU family sensor histidine kinase